MVAALLAPSPRALAAAGGAAIKNGGLQQARTTGAAGWTLQPNPAATAGTRLRGVACPSSLACYAVGDAGMILATTTGGQTWLRQSSATSASLRGIACPSASACYATGDGGTIVRTTDGGQTWTATQSGTTNDLLDIACPSTGVCYASGRADTVVVTTDGGATWSARNVSFCSPGNICGSAPDLYGIACPTPRACYVVEGLYGTIDATTDGGRHWDEQRTGTNGDSLYRVACRNARTCAAIGAIDLATSDGGKTWTNLPISGNNHNTILYGLACARADTCYVVGAKGAIAVLTHGGGAWGTQSSGATRDLYDIACPTPRVCYAVGAGGTIVVTTTGGGVTRAQPSVSIDAVHLYIRPQGTQSLVETRTVHLNDLVLFAADFHAYNAGSATVRGSFDLNGTYTFPLKILPASNGAGGTAYYAVKFGGPVAEKLLGTVYGFFALDLGPARTTHDLDFKVVR